MNIPAIIKAGGMEYVVSLKPLLEIMHGQASGETDHVAGTITIADDYCRQQQELILLHEIFHIAYDKAGLNTRFSPEVEEQMVDALSNGVFDILKQNDMLK